MSDDSTKQHLFALMAHAEEQQKNIDQTIDIINKQQAQIESLHKQLPNLAQHLFTAVSYTHLTLPTILRV